MSRIYTIIILALIASHCLAQNGMDINYDAFTNARITGLPEINTKQIEFAPFPMDNALVFLQAPKKSKPFELMHYDLKSGLLNKLNALMNLPSEFHHGPVSYLANKKTLYYSTNNPVLSKANRSNMMLSSLSLGDQDSISNFEHNSAEYSIMHPTINKAGDVLIFASDMPNGFGGIDLYVSRKMTDNTWTKPVNLGPRVNTQGNDLFPFFYQDRWLFFSSDGREGYGGFDIYVSQLIQGAFGKAKNLGESLNSDKDDISLVFFPEDERTAYFSSNRKGGQGRDDIYRLSLSEPFYQMVANTPDNLAQSKPFVFHLFDRTTHQPLTAVNLLIQEKNSAARKGMVVVIPQKTVVAPVLEASAFSDINGRLEFTLHSEKEYTLLLQREGYKTNSIDFNASKNINDINIFLEQIK